MEKNLVLNVQNSNKMGNHSTWLVEGLVRVGALVGTLNEIQI